MVSPVSKRSHFIDLVDDLSRFFLADLTQDELKQLIDKYQPLIKSKRVSSYILTVRDLFEVLEARNVLNETSVEILKEIGEVLQRSGASQRVEAYKRLVVPPNPPAQAPVPLLPAPAASSVPNHLQRVISIVAENIGPVWRELARNLKVREQDIMQISARCGSNHSQGAEQVLKAYWEHYPQANHVNEIKEAIRRMNRMTILRKINDVSCNGH